MRKYISPFVTAIIGMFMICSALFYTLVIHSVVNTAQMDSLHKLYWYSPALVLTLWGMAIDIYATVMRPLLRFSAEADAWVLK